MHYASYQEITATPETQAAFLRQVREGFEATDKPGEELHAFMRRTIEVGDKPFSQVAHLTRLENDSDAWDLLEAPVELRKALAEDAQALHQIERGYDVPHFIIGFEVMVNELREQRVELEVFEAPEAKVRQESQVKVNFDFDSM